MSTSTQSTVHQRINRTDIEAKLRELQGEVDGRVDSAKTIATAVVTGAAVVVVLAAYWMGRRRGRRRQTVLEIRRI